jgi:lipopolysaccharide export LptBFGC system permease protein LptF
VGGLGYLLDDQVIPRLRPLADRAEEQIEQGTAPKAGQTHAGSAGWRTGGAFWCARNALPNLAVFDHVTAFAGAPGSMTVMTAERMDWRDGAWRLHQVVMSGHETLRRVAEATPPELGLTLKQSPAELALQLRPEQNKTSNELLAARTSRTWRVILSRVLWIFAPLLCLAGSLPLFTRWESRYRLGAVGAQAVAVLVLGLAGITVVTRLLTSTGQNPFIVSSVAVAAIVGVSLWRWRGLRV